MRTLSPLELSSGLVIPERRRAHRLPDLPAGTTPRAAAEAAILPALRRSGMTRPELSSSGDSVRIVGRL